MSVKTYSFSDVNLTLSHPSLGQISTNGMGLGTIQVSMRTDRSSIEVASDGTPVVSKIKDRTGTLAVTLLKLHQDRTSDLNNNLRKWYNYLESAATSEWSLIKAVITSKQTGDQDIMNGGSIVKLPDKSFEQTAGNITWNFLFADVTQNTI